MSESDYEWAVESVDTTALGKPPAIRWRIVDGRMLADDLPHGFSIVVSTLGRDSDGRPRNRVILRRAGRVFEDCIQTQHPCEDGLLEDPTDYAADLAGGLYWAAWRAAEWRARHAGDVVKR